MCGIAAAIAYSAGADTSPAGQIRVMCDSMICRGPDGHGVWTSGDERVALGHRRLSIIDLSDRGAQPMASADGSAVVTFNGEIYNYRELRRDLEKKGHAFRSESDTEVLLQLYREYGRDMLQLLRGMFAFALWDRERHGLLLARDPFGIKPLYVADDGACVWAASEVKTLLHVSTIDRSSEPAGHVGFYLWGHVPEPFTLHRGVRSVPAGSWMWISRTGHQQIERYADLTDLLHAAERSSVGMKSGEIDECLRIALLDSVKHHLVADVDVGVFLSSGLDSTTLTALASEVGGQLRTVTLGFEEFRGTERDETPHAEMVARQYGALHTTIWITRQDFESEFGRLLSRMDQPSIDGVNSYFVAKAAAAAGLKVAISGLGGDELFGGYGSFREIPRLVATLRRVPRAASLGPALRTAVAPLISRFTSPKYAGLLEYGGHFAGAYLLRRGLFLPWEITRVFDRDFALEGCETLRTLDQLSTTVGNLSLDRFKVSALEASWYMRNQLLRDTDWASMSHSLEVRVPLVDWVLWQTVAQLVAMDRGLDKRRMALTARPPLPTQIVERPKTGFSTPTRDWLLQRETQARFAERGLRGWAHYVHQAAA